jgi:peptidylprolyl isomerase
MKNFLLLSILLWSSFMNIGNAEIGDKLDLQLKDGVVVIELLPEIAPNHVARIKELVKEKFYDGIVFHRVIDGFMAQTGDPTGTGSGGSGRKINAEFSSTPHKRGIVSMARAQNPNSADSQFFIVLADSTYLDNQYTVFGRVISGMEFVDKIKKGNSSRNGEVSDPDKIISMMISDK